MTGITMAICDALGCHVRAGLIPTRLPPPLT